MKTTRNKAIKLARNNVSELSAFGDSYTFSTYSPMHSVWRQSVPRNYHNAQSARSQTLIDIARDAIGLDAVQYDGGSWINYL